MLKINQINEKSVSIDNGNSPVVVHSVFYAQVVNSVLELIPEKQITPAFSEKLESVEINGTVYNDPEEAIQALIFIGNFKAGGASSSSTDGVKGITYNGGDLKTPDSNGIVDIEIPIATVTLSGLMSKDDKAKVNSSVQYSPEGNIVLDVNQKLLGTADNLGQYELIGMGKYEAGTGEAGEPWYLEQAEIGSQNARLNLNTKDKITVDTLEGKKIVPFEEDVVLNGKNNQQLNILNKEGEPILTTETFKEESYWESSTGVCADGNCMVSGFLSYKESGEIDHMITSLSSVGRPAIEIQSNGYTDRSVRFSNSGNNFFFYTTTNNGPEIVNTQLFMTSESNNLVSGVKDSSNPANNKVDLGNGYMPTTLLSSIRPKLVIGTGSGKSQQEIAYLSEVPKEVTLTQSEYNILKTNGQLDPDTYYNTY